MHKASTNGIPGTGDVTQAIIKSMELLHIYLGTVRERFQYVLSCLCFRCNGMSVVFFLFLV